MSPLQTSQKAFTLVEVLMAATVLVVSFTAVIQAVTVGADMIDTARKQQIAQQIIEGEIAYQRTRPWYEIVPGETAIADVSTDIPLCIRISDDGISYTDETSTNNKFDGQYFGLPNNKALMAVAKGFTCQEYATPIRSSFLSITYTVTWAGYLGRLHTRTGVAYFGQNGLHLSYDK